MKKVLLILSVIMVSCSTIKKLNTDGFRSENNIIFYEKDSVAILRAIEYSIDNKKYVKEMTFKLVNMKHADKVENLLYFIHKRHKDWEIELDYPINNFKVD